MERLAGFVQWMSGGVYWMQVCSVATNALTSLDVLLLSLCRRFETAVCEPLVDLTICTKKSFF